MRTYVSLPRLESHPSLSHTRNAEEFFLPIPQEGNREILHPLPENFFNETYYLLSGTWSVFGPKENFWGRHQFNSPPHCLVTYFSHWKSPREGLVRDQIKNVVESFHPPSSFFTCDPPPQFFFRKEGTKEITLHFVRLKDISFPHWNIFFFFSGNSSFETILVNRWLIRPDISHMLHFSSLFHGFYLLGACGKGKKKKGFCFVGGQELNFCPRTPLSRKRR